MNSAFPPKRRHPVISLLLVRLPLQFLFAVLTIFNVAYLGAYIYFNDQVLGEFVGTRVSRILEGDLEIGSLHWNGRLIFDLLTGTPHKIIAKDVTVWEPYESYDHGRERKAAHARELELHLVLHEIIPWNRAGIPRLFEIPWVLHFDQVRSTDRVDLAVRQYPDTINREEVIVLGLRDAFRPSREPPPDQRGLSVVVGKADLKDLMLDVDFRQTDGNWRAGIAFNQVNFNLEFWAPDPASPPVDLPFDFDVSGTGTRGALQIRDLELPLGPTTVHRMRSNRGAVDIGDVAFALDIEAAGSPFSLQGDIRNVFPKWHHIAPRPPMYIDLTGDSPTVDRLVAHLIDHYELSPSMVVGRRTPMAVTIRGPLDNPVFGAELQRLSLDLLGEPAWAADDVDTTLSLTRTTVPELWQPRFEPWADRWVLTIEHLNASLLNGAVELPNNTRPGKIVLPQQGEAFLISMPLELRGVDPGQLAPDSPEAQATLRGSLDGGVDLHELIVGPPTSPQAQPSDEGRMQLLYADVTFGKLTAVRDRGPSVDHIPRRIGIDGDLEVFEGNVFDIDALAVTTDGTRLVIDGGLDLGAEKLRELLLDLSIVNGEAFARAFGLPPYFAQLNANLTLTGPLRSPSGHGGSLSIRDLLGDSALDADASISMDRGTLELRAVDTPLLGGRANLLVRLGLFENGTVSSNPKVFATLELDNADVSLLRDEFAGRANITVEVGDGEGHAARLKQVRVVGVARAPQLELAGTTYSEASLAFQLFEGELAIDKLVLPIHRAVSPRLAGRATVPVGELAAEGTIKLQDDPQLDLFVRAHGVPMSTVSGLLGTNTVVRGQIGEGTELQVGGTISQPSVEGKVELAGLSAQGIPLGSGTLVVESDDFDRDGPLARHREVRVNGDLATRPPRRRGRGRREPLRWTIRAVLAIARKPGSSTPAVTAEVDVDFDELSMQTLLRDPADPDAEAPISGTLFGLAAHVLTCSEGPPLLSDCIRDGGPTKERSLTIELSLDDAWVRGGDEPNGDPCQDPATLCTASRLDAKLEWPIVEIARPFKLRSGGRGGDELAIQGKFDLSQPPEAKARSTKQCEPPALGTPDLGVLDEELATIEGAIDFRVLAGLVPGAGIESASGRLGVDLQVREQAMRPDIRGRAELLGKTGGPLRLRLDRMPFPVAFDNLELAIDDGWVTARGSAVVEGSELRFGTVEGAHTGFAIDGPCVGKFGAAAQGQVSGQIIGAFVNGVGSDGGLELERARILGDTRAQKAEDIITALDGSIRFGDALRPGTTCQQRPPSSPAAPNVLLFELDNGITQATFDCGTVSFDRCKRGSCGEGQDGWFSIRAGDSANATPARDAIRARSDRGHALVWGSAFVSPTVDRIAEANVHINLDELPYRSFDGRGRLAYEADLSAKNVTITGGSPLVVNGQIFIDRGRYVKDAIENVGILQLTEEVETAAGPPNPLLRQLQFNLEVSTDHPFRIENNLASGVQATVDVDVKGSYTSPEISGRIEVEPGGTVDIPFLTGTYEIQRGRVTLVREFRDAEVDVIALRREPVYIDDQPRRITLVLGGTLNAITWGCQAEGDTSGELDSVRGCTEYLVLGAGDVQISEQDVQRFGSGGLAQARKSLQVVGHLTEINIGERAAEAAPRLRRYIPDLRLRLGQIGPELQIATPSRWFNWDWGQATFGFDYTRGYPGFLLREERELRAKIEILEPASIEFRRRNRSYLNNRIIFDPLQQRSLELKFDFQLPSLR